MGLLPVRTDGFYYSGPIQWEEWHAGVRMREVQYHFWRFYPDGNWVCCHRCTSEFDFWRFTETLGKDTIERAKVEGTRQIEDGLELFRVGTYSIESGILMTAFEWRVPLHPSGHQVFHTQMRWRILGDSLVPLQESDRDPLRFMLQPSV